MTVKETEYGDLTGGVYPSQMSLEKKGLTSLEGSPKRVIRGYYIGRNKLTDLKFSPEYVGAQFSVYANKTLVSLEGGPKEVGDDFFCTECPKLKNPIEQIIQYQIKARYYYTDEGKFPFSDIETRFVNYVLDKRVKRTSMRTLLGLDK